MAIYVWLEHLKVMHKYKTEAELQVLLDKVDNLTKINIQNQNGFKIFTEENTKYWND